MGHSDGRALFEVVSPVTGFTSEFTLTASGDTADEVDVFPIPNFLLLIV